MASSGEISDEYSPFFFALHGCTLRHCGRLCPVGKSIYSALAARNVAQLHGQSRALCLAEHAMGLQQFRDQLGCCLQACALQRTQQLIVRCREQQFVQFTFIQLIGCCQSAQ